LLHARLGVGDLAGGVSTGGADLVLCSVANLLDFGNGTSADLADFFSGRRAEFGEFAFEVLHAGDRLGGGVVGLLAVGVCGVAFGLGVSAALDLFGKAGLGGGNALLGTGARGVHLGLG
jgi:hypothetical protein